MTNGFRAFRAERLSQLSFEFETYWAIIMTLLAGRAGLSVSEIPVHGEARKGGKSQFKSWFTYVRYNIMVIRQILGVYL